MKKFLIFLVSLVVVVCVGLTTYYFMRNNEIITIKTKEIYCNAGDTIPLNSLGISIEKANVSKKTTFNYNAGGEDVTKYIKYDAESNAFIVSQENGGEVTLVISTSNKKYTDFKIKVHIGNGSVENPYYIFSESDLNKIGSTYRLDRNYKLMNNITLTSKFKPIGYNANTSSWESFNGTFDGQGYTIKGLNLADVESTSVGLFSTLGENSKVTNLTIDNATISGAYENAGILAGEVNGTVEKVIVTNSTLTNSSSNSATGAIAGKLTNNIKLSYAENVTINLNGTEEASLVNVKAGGLIGSVVETTVQACYTNNVNINITNASATAGGFAGELVIGTDSGSIQQSYANTTCTDANFGAFVGTITQSSTFNAENAKMLRHLVGNIAVVYGVESTESITDNKLVAEYDNTFFKNTAYAENSAFFDKKSALYLVRGFAGVNELITTNEFVFYAIDSTNIKTWDTTNVWNTSNNSLPTLRMSSINPDAPSIEYINRDMEEIAMGDKETFVYTFAEDLADSKVKLLSDVDLTNGWTPVAISNTIVDGNNKTITINLNNAVDNNLGLFTTIENSTIKNLNIVVTGVSANASFAGALAGKILSNSNTSSSTIENVTVTYQGFANPTITNFGGIAGSIENTTITNCKVEGLAVSESSAVSNAGAIAAVTTGANAKIQNCEVSATVAGTISAGGVVAYNGGSITDVTGSVNVIGNANNQASFGGVAGNNAGTINNVKVTANIAVKNANGAQFVGGVAGTNSGAIQTVTITGEKIEVTTDSTSAIYIGGVVGTNSGTITNVNNTIATVGTYKEGLNHYVGGVVAVNAGEISKVLTQSNINGNYVSGVVAQMNTQSATIDQVVVGKYNATDKVLGQNTIIGDKYLAGISVDFKAGTITNVQSASVLNGQTNATRSSLVVLVFANGATLRNATIDSSFTGYAAATYREVWTDFEAFSNKAEFGLADDNTSGLERFNLYRYDSAHGCMQSVVINASNAGVSGAKASMGTAFAWEKDYQDTENSSYVKTVDAAGFKDSSQFSGSFEFVCAISSWFGNEHKATKTLTFGIGTEWETNNGISLMFLNNIVAA